MDIFETIDCSPSMGRRPNLIPDTLPLIFGADSEPYCMRLHAYKHYEDRGGRLSSLDIAHFKSMVSDSGVRGHRISTDFFNPAEIDKSEHLKERCKLILEAGFKRLFFEPKGYQHQTYLSFEVQHCFEDYCLELFARFMGLDKRFFEYNSLCRRDRYPYTVLGGLLKTLSIGINVEPYGSDGLATFTVNRPYLPYQS